MKKVLLLVVGLGLLWTNAFAFDPAVDTPTLSKTLAVAPNTPVPFSETGIQSDFYHKYTFTLPESSFSISAVSLQFPRMSQISDFSAYLYKADDLTKIFEVTGDSLIEKKVDLLAGEYFLALTGTAAGLMGGSYTGLLAATNPVPLPGAALFLGAGVLGLIGLRRKNQNA